MKEVICNMSKWFIEIIVNLNIHQFIFSSIFVICLYFDSLMDFIEII